MCSARKFVKFSLFQGFLVEFWCFLQGNSASWQNCDVFYKKNSEKSHWNQQKDLLRSVLQRYLLSGSMSNFSSGSCRTDNLQNTSIGCFWYFTSSLSSWKNKQDTKENLHLFLGNLTKLSWKIRCVLIEKLYQKNIFWISTCFSLVNLIMWIT